MKLFTTHWDRRSLFAIPLALAVALLSCSIFSRTAARQGDAAWEEQKRNLGIHDWNSSLELSLPEPVGDPFAGEPIEVLLMNRSSDFIWFPLNYGSKGYLYLADQDTWLELPNEMNYVGREDVLEPRMNANSNWAAAVSILLILPPLNGDTTLRLVVEGRRVRDGTITSEAVGGYVDLTLSP